MSVIRSLLIAALFALASFTASAEPVDVNTATVQELQVLQGVGPKKAAAIIAYREKHGSFGTVEELTKVSGIGAKLLEANRENLKVD